MFYDGKEIVRVAGSSRNQVKLPQELFTGFAMAKLSRT
jgi:hypothetical protein